MKAPKQSPVMAAAAIASYLTGAGACSPEERPAQPPQQIATEVKACIDETVPGYDNRTIVVRGVVPKTGEGQAEVTLDIGVGVDAGFANLMLPSGAEAEFRLGAVVDRAVARSNATILTVVDGNGGPPERLSFHVEGTAPDNPDSQPFENCGDVDYYPVDGESPRCVCDTTGNDCYVWTDWDDESDPLDYNCDGVGNEFTCYSIGKVKKDVCDAPAEKNDDEEN